MPFVPAASVGEACLGPDRGVSWKNLENDKTDRARSARDAPVDRRLVRQTGLFRPATVANPPPPPPARSRRG
jgi:hypothetical protein